MSTKIILPTVLIFFTSIGVAPTRKVLHGKITVLNATPSDVLILNVNTQNEVKSKADGSFLILAQPNDQLDFASPNLDYIQKTVTQADFDLGEIRVEMTAKQIVLDEVEVKTYNAVHLGIATKQAKRYTPAERRLKTAGDFKPIHLLSILGGSMPLDPVFNAINGKTKRLKKEVILERNAKRLTDFLAWFPPNELIARLKIHPDEVYAFVYFVLEEKQFISLFESNDRNRMDFYLIEMFTEFNSKKTAP